MIAIALLIERAPQDLQLITPVPDVQRHIRRTDSSVVFRFQMHPVVEIRPDKACETRMHRLILLPCQVSAPRRVPFSL